MDECKGTLLWCETEDCRNLECDRLPGEQDLLELGEREDAELEEEEALE